MPWVAVHQSSISRDELQQKAGTAILVPPETNLIFVFVGDALEDITSRLHLICTADF